MIRNAKIIFIDVISLKFPSSWKTKQLILQSFGSNSLNFLDHWEEIEYLFLIYLIFKVNISQRYKSDSE